jgi:hypothetical protein
MDNKLDAMMKLLHECAHVKESKYQPGSGNIYHYSNPICRSLGKRMCSVSGLHILLALCSIMH